MILDEAPSEVVSKGETAASPRMARSPAEEEIDEPAGKSL
jgi:hypothetical protein